VATHGSEESIDLYELENIGKNRKRRIDFIRVAQLKIKCSLVVSSFVNIGDVIVNAFSFSLSV
jgi:hypothetical protein